MFAIYGGKAEFNQWDLNQLVTNPCMKEGDEVVFKGFGKAYETTAYSKNGEVVADVPNFILQKPGTIIVDLGWGLNVRLKCRTEFNVVAKEKPADYDCDCNIENRPEKNSGGVSSWNDLTDKPFGEETVYEVIKEVSGSSDEPFVIEDGKKYIVTFDGVDYECVARSAASGVVGIGNWQIAGAQNENTGEPFIIYSLAYMSIWMAADGAGHNYVLKNINTVTTPIEGKYLPDDAVIIDVLALPTSNIDEHRFYRIPKGMFVSEQNIMNGKVYIVEGLPATGDPVTMDGQSVNAGYYNTLDNDVYGYLPDAIASAAGVPAGWHPFSTLAPLFGVGWSGVIGDILDCPMDASLALLLEGNVWYHKYGWRPVNPVGRQGEGIFAEVFNHPSNVASGMYSHAEGRHTTASGTSAHAEGHETTATGAAAHAEGQCTVAVGAHQHVQGYYNVIDEIDPATKRGKYAHIVGNGYSDSNRRNAHTLDWDGNAWFASKVEAKAVILPSPNGTRYKITVSDDGTLSATAL